MNKIEIFKREGFHEIRVVLNEQGEPLFCLTDICKVLGILNTPQVGKQLDIDEVYKVDSLTYQVYMFNIYTDNQTLNV
jgi:prophage antirepressor-like protein